MRQPDRQPEQGRRVAGHQPQHAAARKLLDHKLSNETDSSASQPHDHSPPCSVSDKTGIVDFARALHAQGVRLLSTGGTARLLADAGLPVTEVAEVTGFPEMLDGRVKTLHPRIHGGLLARRDLPEHMAALAAHGIGTIDLLVVNLYPFAQATARADCTLEDAIENIDIGGPAMLRAAAKNWADVAVVIDPADYPGAGRAGQARRHDRATKFMLAQEGVCAHRRLRRHDHQLPERAGAGAEDAVAAVPARDAYPAVYNLQLVKTQDMRYGENPHQSAAFYREARARRRHAGATGRSCRARSCRYNNIADADAAWECVKTFDEPACVIVKHANPCGVAVGATLVEAYLQGLETDPTSAFGGILAFNRPLDAEPRPRIRWRQAVRRSADRARRHARSARRASPPSRTCACWKCRWPPAPTRWTSSAWAAACCCSRPTPRT
jgi:phosphoribosylaminoimidazolecarboxamide formyltransferase/IMP cyclohydrolase